MKNTNLLLTPENFCFWLNGFAELTPEPPTAEQWKSIKEHLALVFTKVTPKAPGNDPAPSVFDDIRKIPPFRDGGAVKPNAPKPLDHAWPCDKYWPFIRPEYAKPWEPPLQITC